jgi:hypothetical protein
MQFYFTLLLLHRPFIDLDSAVATFSHLDEAPGCATTICPLAATNIAKVTRDYSLFYSLKQVPSPAIHFIFTAATIHLINHQIYQDDQHSYRFKGCLSGLAEIAEASPIAHKAVSVLQSLLQRLERGQNHVIGTAQHLTQSKDQETPIALDDSSDLLLSVSNVTANMARPGQTLEHQQSYGASETRSPRAGTDSLFRNDTQQPSLVELGNFDWSTYNSPIALPSDVGNANLDVNGFSTADSHILMPTAFTFPQASVYGGMSNVIHEPGYDVTGFGVELDNKIFNRFHGITFGLN